ncbi:MAG TPA: hypothetical protein PK644_10935, partial [bacterium]|nr:hypothetical protein [bacterium]
ALYRDWKRSLVTQALARGEIADLAQLREIVRNSFPLIVFQPKDTSLWDEKYQLYQSLKNRQETPSDR